MPRHAPAPSTQLRLRGGARPLSAQLVWPAVADTRPAVMVLLVEPGAAGPAEALCRSLGILSLIVACRGLDDGVAAIEWTADHAAHLGADGERLLLAGLGGGGVLAAAVALHARNHGWPDVTHLDGEPGSIADAVRDVLDSAP